MLYENIKKLVEYGIQTGLTPECERIYTTNLLLELFQEDSYEDVEIDSSSIELEAVLEGLLDEAVKRGIIEDSIGFRDLFDTKIMNCLVPRPAQVQKTFAEKYEESPEAATEYFYKLSQDSNYIGAPHPRRGSSLCKKRKGQRLWRYPVRGRHGSTSGRCFCRQHHPAGHRHPHEGRRDGWLGRSAGYRADAQRHPGGNGGTERCRCG